MNDVIKVPVSKLRADTPRPGWFEALYKFSPTFVVHIDDLPTKYGRSRNMTINGNMDGWYYQGNDSILVHNKFAYIWINKNGRRLLELALNPVKHYYYEIWTVLFIVLFLFFKFANH